MGSYVIQVTAFDGQGGNAFVEFFLDVIPTGGTTTNNPPFLSLPLLDKTLEENQNVFIDLNGTFDDIDGDFLSYAVTGLPPSLFLDTATNTINGTTTAADIGEPVIAI